MAKIIEDMVRIKRKEEMVLGDKRIRQRIQERNIDDPEEDNKNRYGLWFVAFIAIIFLFFAISFLFTDAKITINPKLKNINLNQDFSAFKNSNNETLPFQLVAVFGEESKTIEASEEKEVSQKAKGKISIFNSFSALPQTVVAGTQLEGSNGKIYKTDTKVIVPGLDKDGTPGSIDVGITAKEPGEEYNSEPIDFKILAFKNTAKYSKIYARSQGNVNGGIVGKLHVVGDSEKDSVIAELTGSLKDKLFKKVTADIPEGFVLFNNAVFLSVDDKDVGSYFKDINAEITIKGTLYGILFEEKKLTKKIIDTDNEKYDTDEVFIPNIENLVFTLSDPNISFGDVETIDFNLSGPTKVVWRVDSGKIISELLGKSKKEFNKVLTNYPNIDSADLVVKPAWKTSFPDKIEDFDIVINYPQ